MNFQWKCLAQSHNRPHTSYTSSLCNIYSTTEISSYHLASKIQLRRYIFLYIQPQSSNRLINAVELTLLIHYKVVNIIK